MTAHTPAPWPTEDTIVRLSRGVCAVEDVAAVQVGDVSSVVAYVPIHYEEGRQRANARLIAAAPELYSVAKELWASPYAGERRILDMAEAAIAKAEGR